MPVLIKNFSWTQTRDLVCLRIPLKTGVPKTKVDVTLGSDYFKLSHPVSHILELFLKHSVETENNNVEFVEGGKWICVDLKKAQTGVKWSSLEKEAKYEKSEHVFLEINYS